MPAKLKLAPVETPAVDEQQTAVEAALSKLVEEHAHLLRWRGQVEAKLKELKAQIAESEEALKEYPDVLAAMDLAMQGKSTALSGPASTIEVCPGRKKTEVVDMTAIREALGEKTFMKTCTFPVGKLSAHFTEDEIAAVANVTRHKPLIKLK